MTPATTTIGESATEATSFDESNCGADSEDDLAPNVLDSQVAPAKAARKVSLVGSS